MVRFVLGRNVDMEDVAIRTTEFQTIDDDLGRLEHELERGWRLMGAEVLEEPAARYPEVLKEAAEKVAAYTSAIYTPERKRIVKK